MLRASRRMSVAQPTISAQIKQLERTLQERLFERDGRRLVLTDVGQLVFRYAEDMFELGLELQRLLKGQPTGRPIRFKVGIADVLPKPVSYLLLEPIMELPHPVRLVCYESEPRRLLADLVAHSLDLVLTDSPPMPSFRQHTHCHVLGRTGITLMASPSLAHRYRRQFPRSLENAPFLLPTMNTNLRSSLESWFDRYDVEPTVVAESEDSALLQAFAQDSRGILAVHDVIVADVQRLYGLERVGRADGIEESFYAVSVDRKFRSPAISAIQRAAHDRFAHRDR